MNFLVLLVISVVFLSCYSSSNLVELSYQNWEKEMTQGKIFVKFYAPWCGFCKKLAPIWEELAQEEELLTKGIRIGKLDCTVSNNDPLCKQYGVTSFPTLKLFDKGKESKFEGDRSLQSLKTFALNTIPSIPTVSTVPKNQPIKWSENSNITEVDLNNSEILNSGTWLAVFYADWCINCQKMSSILEQVATHYKGSSIQISRLNIDKNPGAIIKRIYSVSEVPTIKLLKNGNMYNMTYESQDVKGFIEFIEKDYLKAGHIPIPIIPSFNTKQEKKNSNVLDSTFPSLMDLPSYFSEQETILGLVLASLLFGLGFIFGRISGTSKAKKD